MSEILSLVSLIFAHCTTWFLQTMEAVDGVGVWLTAVMVYLCFKFILSPVFGSAGSDRVSKRQTKGSYRGTKRQTNGSYRGTKHQTKGD